MSVYVTLRVSLDPAAFEKVVAEHPDQIGRIMAIARSKGLIAHRWFRGDGMIMAVDEWPDAQSFQDFFSLAAHEIAPLMSVAGATTAPEITVWDHLAIDDTFGWGA